MFNGIRHFCHWWQSLCGSRLSAMEILFAAALAALAPALVAWARGDRFATRGAARWFD